MTGLSLLRCQRCGQTTGDVTRTFCPPCKRHTDHQHRLTIGDPWYLHQIARFGADLYGDGWEHDPGLEYVRDLFGDTRALAGWHGVGVDDVEAPRRPRLKVKTRPCRRCGETTSSASGYFCAGCHFAGWWGQWADEQTGYGDAGETLAERSIA